MDYRKFNKSTSSAKDLIKEYKELVGLKLPPETELLPEFYAIELCRYRISQIDFDELDDDDSDEISKLDSEQRLRYDNFPKEFKELLKDLIADNSKVNTNSYFF